MSDRFIVAQQASLTHKKSLLRAIARNAIPEVENALEDIADRAIAKAQENYETADEGATYERTFQMFNAWKSSPATFTGGDVEVTILNDAVELTRPWRHYSALVQGELQTFRHNGAGWNTIRDILTDLSHIQAARVREAIRRAGNK